MHDDENAMNTEFRYAVTMFFEKKTKSCLQSCEAASF